MISIKKNNNNDKKINNNNSKSKRRHSIKGKLAMIRRRKPIQGGSPQKILLIEKLVYSQQLKPWQSHSNNLYYQQHQHQYSQENPPQSGPPQSGSIRNEDEVNPPQSGPPQSGTRLETELNPPQRGPPQSGNNQL